jgi:CYTH domain-containing protein/predicted ATPase
MGNLLIQPVSMIVLTGGPCSGKSSSLAHLTQKLSDHGFMVFVVPETATLITNNGIDRRKMDKRKQVVMFEETIFDMQLAFEEIYKKAVKRIFPERKKVILLDRGIMDVKAFIPQDDFKAILEKKRLSEVSLRDRYSGVIHLVTAAEGAIEFYNGSNNSARLETPEEALRFDHAIRESWLGHPHFKIIDNRTDFDGKIKRTFTAISQFLNIPVSSEKKEIYLVKAIDYSNLPVHQTIEFSEIYLRMKNESEEVRIRKRGQDGAYLYFLTRKKAIKNHENYIEEEEIITEQEFNTLKNLIDPKTLIIEKERICFLWNNQYFELDKYKGLNEGLIILEIEQFEKQGEKEIMQTPPFISIEKMITGNPRYSTKKLALKHLKKKQSTASNNIPQS